MREMIIGEGQTRRFTAKALELGVLPFYLDHPHQSSIHPHRHQFFELVLVLSGKATHRLENNQFQVSEGEVLLLGHHLPHAYEIGKDDFHIINICFDPSVLFPGTEGASLDYFENYKLLRPFFWETQTSVCLKPDELTFSRLVNLALDLMVRFREKDIFLQRESLKAGLLSLLWVLCAHYQKISPVTKPEEKFIEKALQLINQEDLENKISLTSLASKLGLNIYSFSRNFKKQIGKSLPAYLNQIRIAQAQTLLRESTLSVTDIALKCGFPNLSHFHHTFKEETHLTPKEYQTLITKNHTPPSIKNKTK